MMIVDCSAYGAGSGIKPKSKSLGQVAYENDLARYPTYSSGRPRPTWEQISDFARESWERDPTSR